MKGKQVAIETVTLSVRATTNLDMYKGVTIAGIVPPLSGDQIAGFTTRNIKIGEPIGVIREGEAWAIAAENITVEDKLSVNTDGNVKIQTLGEAGCGRALEDVTTGNKFRILVIQDVAVTGSGSNAASVSIEKIGTPTYKTVQHFINIIESAGRISGGIISDAGAGKIDVAAGTGFIKTSDSNVGVTKSFDWIQELAIVLTDNSINYIYMDYNAGSPQVGVTVDRTTINGHTEFTLGRVYRKGTDLHIINSGMNVTEIVYREHERLLKVRGFERANGAVVSETGVRNLASTIGLFYLGFNEIITIAQDTSGADTFVYWYHVAGVWTTSTGNTQIDNLKYDNGTDLANLTVNRYGVFWVFIHYDSDLQVVYGRGDYKLTDAEDAILPDDIPNRLLEFGGIAAKIIIQQNAGSFNSIVTSYEQYFPISFPPNHIDLGGLTTGDDHTQYAKIAGRAGGQQITGGIASGDDLTLESTSDATKGDLIVLPNGGRVGIGTAPATADALLELTSTTKALVVPRMTTVQRDLLTAVNGMIIYDTTLNQMQGYENGAWVDL